MSQPPENATELVAFVIKCWRLDELAGFAAARHGYGSDGFGVTYPEDLDPGDEPMASGTVEIYGGYSDAFSFVIPEATYLAILTEIFRASGRADEADAVARL